MPSLVFPNSDALRVALASGIVPAALARKPVLGSVEEIGSIRIHSPSEWPKELLNSLARIGVKTSAATADSEAREYPMWARAAPLRPTAEIPRGPVLYEMPADSLPVFVAALRRVAPQSYRYRIVDSHALVMLEKPITLFLQDVRTYRSPAEGLWIETGFTLGNLPREVLETDRFLRVTYPRNWHVAPAEAFRQEFASHSVSPVKSSVPKTSGKLPKILVNFRLVRSEKNSPERFWVATGSWESIAGSLRDREERVLRRLDIAVLQQSNNFKVILGTREKGLPPMMSYPFEGFSPVEEVKGFFLPSGYRLAPKVRPANLAAAFALSGTRATWLEKEGEKYSIHRLERSAFRPLGEHLKYSIPAFRPWKFDSDASTLFALPGFVVQAEPGPAVDELPKFPFVPPSKQTKPERDKRGWLKRLTGRLFSGSNKAEKEDDYPSNAAGPMVNAAAVPAVMNEWIARRQQLERILLEMPASTADTARAKVWRELAEIHEAMGTPAEAALGWLNALWCRDTLSAEWVEHWLQSEAKLARIPPEELTPAAILARKPGPMIARVAGALAVQKSLGSSGEMPVAEIQALLESVEKQSGDLPVRLVWLARLAAANATRGDALALARTRDKLIARLAGEGPALDLDAPSFLRFHENVGSERFHTAREWLVKARESVHKWLKKHVGVGRLQWAGLEADIPATRAYADLMFAWGMAKLGDRTRALDWQDGAEAILAKASGPGVEPAVHRYLLDLFREKIRTSHRDAENNSAAAPSLPAFAQPELSRYAVEKLLAHSNILRPAGARDPFGHLGLFSLVDPRDGTLRLTKILQALPTGSVEDSLALLDEAEREPTANALPSRAFIALELPASAETAKRLLKLFPDAMGLLPEALRIVRSSDDDGRAAFLRLAIRGIELACQHALRFDCGEEFGKLCTALGELFEEQKEAYRDIWRATAATVFRTCRKLGRTAESAELVRKLAARNALTSEEKLACATGWLTLGEEDRGLRLLNDSRSQLFERGMPNERERTATALAYVRTLAHAPPRLALGRLEELFQRLDRVTTTGATARYYALKPLEIVDAAIAAVVTDDFGLGPAVRGWMADDEFRIRQRIGRDLNAAINGNPM